MSAEKEYLAVVQKCLPNGVHGPYAVASSDDLGSITFSLNQTVWKENDWPEPGTCVMLSKVRKKRAGWRAQQGRFFKPSDTEITQNQNSDKEKRV